ncbi:MAG TPA: tail fiber protein [Dehalococcoidales bacterium]|nr:tail fiber protein [Dehalococcoidales bacterium]
MSIPFLGEITIFGFNFPPRGWASCDGQILPINQNQALFFLLGTTYGGDGRTTFALPDLRGRVPVHPGDHGVTWEGTKGGGETQALNTTDVPAHTHQLSASNLVPNRESPGGNYLAASALNPYTPASPDKEMKPGSISGTGNGQGHENMQPFLVLNFCIALQGVFPSQN